MASSNYALPPIPDNPSLSSAGNAGVAGAATDLPTDNHHQQQADHVQQDHQFNQNEPIDLQHQPHQQQQQLHHPYEHHGLASPTSQATATAIATAHHGLQALQAVTGMPVSAPASVTPQYAASPSLASPLLDGQYHSLPPGHSPPVQQSPLQPSQQKSAQKVTRLRRACDLCSSRKVKCDAAGPPCKPCRDLNVECTFNRAMKRRGPPNKHAEAARAAKQPRLEPSLQSSQQSPQSNFHPSLHPALQANGSVGMSPTPHTAAGTLASIAGNDNLMTLNGLGAEAIAPFEVLEHLVQDFFTYIHPLTPFPHEPTFMKSFYDREDRTNPEFLALLASMIGCLVASFPRAAREHLKSQQTSNLFPRAITMIDRCREVALDARGARFDNKEEITVYDAATSYFLGLAAGYTLQWKLCRRFMSQTITFIREMGYHKPPDLGSSMYGVTYRGPPFDHVRDQLGKRLFWVMLLGVRSMYQLGAPIQDLILPPPTPSEHYPDYPQEVDDQYILPQQILVQPVGEVSLLTGFVQACKIYVTMNPLVSVELSYGLTTLPWPNQRKMLVDCLQKVKDLMKNLPRELTLDMDAVPGQGGPNAFENNPAFQYQPLYSANQPSNDMRSLFRGGQSERRRQQYEIQQANIYASQLATRSYYVERYFNLRDAHRELVRGQNAAQAAYAAATGSTTNGTPVDDNKAVAAAAIQAAMDQDPVDEIMRTEREEIVKNLLTVLTSLPQRNMEPNGGSLINKIRQVASTLLNDNPDHKGPVAMQVQEYLARFLGILTRLEKTGPANGGVGAGVAENHGVMTLQDEEEELRNWADLADHQRRFAAQGGFLMGL